MERHAKCVHVNAHLRIVRALRACELHFAASPRRRHQLAPYQHARPLHRRVRPRSVTAHTICAHQREPRCFLPRGQHRAQRHHRRAELLAPTSADAVKAEAKTLRFRARNRILDALTTRHGRKRSGGSH
eukprot:3349241-Pleurochrysis_carterae.AAC.2